MKRPPLPESILAQAREYAVGSRSPAEPRNAATVVLLRTGSPRGDLSSMVGPGERSEPVSRPGSMDVYLLRRQTSMAFAGGMCVFPGGGVDPRDFDETTAAHWAGPSPEVWGERLGTDEPLARALVCAAVRETFEEAGVLLAGSAPGDVVADTTGDDWEADRVALETRELSLTDFLARRELVLRTDLLGAWSAWLTPIFEPRRYRTWFFVAGLPEGQLTRDVSSESDLVAWLPLGDVLGRVDAGEVMMMPPTYTTCAELTPYADPAAAMVASLSRRVELFMPDVIEVDGHHELSSPPWLTDEGAR